MFRFMRKAALSHGKLASTGTRRVSCSARVHDKTDSLYGLNRVPEPGTANYA